MPEADAVKALFASIAQRYDRANAVLSMGLHRYWRWRVARQVKGLAPACVLDMATGTGDLAFALQQQLGDSASVMGMDFCEPMLMQAREKQKNSHIPFLLGDCLEIPLDANAVDVVTLGFGLRNLEDRGRGLAEIHRVLKPGGVLVVLEFTQPAAWLKPLYWPYVRTLLPWISSKITSNREAYCYLGSSIEAFPTKAVLAEQIQAQGFQVERITGLTGSIVAIHQARAIK